VLARLFLEFSAEEIIGFWATFGAKAEAALALLARWVDKFRQSPILDQD